MKQVHAFGFMFLFAVALLGSADFLSTTISTDGTAMIHETGANENGSFSSRIMVNDMATIGRSINADEGFQKDISVKSAGPILVDEYAETQNHQSIPESIRCVFSDVVSNNPSISDVYASGIMQNGNYSSSQSIHPGLTSGMDVSGPGMMRFGSKTRGNKTLESDAFVSGNMSVKDYVRYGVQI